MKKLNQENFAMRIVREIPIEKGKRRRAVFECKNCKKHINAMVHNMNKKDRVNSGLCKSCATIFFHTTHDLSKTKLYQSWRAMRRRCTYVKGKDYKNYGGRGIIYVKEWDDFNVFKEWALKNGYKDGLTIERNDVIGNYEPLNCKWITRKKQSENKRVLQENNKTGYKGVSKPPHYKKYVVHREHDGKKVNLGVYENKKLAGRVYDVHCIVNGIKTSTNFEKKICLLNECIHRRACIYSHTLFDMIKTENFEIVDESKCMPNYKDKDCKNMFNFLDRFRLSNGEPFNTGFTNKG